MLAKTSPALRYISLPLGTLASLMAATLCQMIFMRQLQSISLFFVIPIGSILLCAIAGYAYFAGRYIYNLPIRKPQYFIAMCIGMILFVSVHYIDYATTYYNEINLSHDKLHSNNEIWMYYPTAREDC